MGRYSTVAITVGECSSLPISTFVKVIKDKTFDLRGLITWESGASLGMTLRNMGERYYLELDYVVTVQGEKFSIKYGLWIIGEPSNLGNGTVYFFICPFKKKFCRRLLMGYGSRYYKCREAYNHRIYYALQLSSRLDKHNDIYWRLERRLEKLYVKHPKEHYRGKPTKASLRLEAMERKKYIMITCGGEYCLRLL